MTAIGQDGWSRESDPTPGSNRHRGMGEGWHTPLHQQKPAQGQLNAVCPDVVISAGGSNDKDGMAATSSSSSLQRTWVPCLPHVRKCSKGFTPLTDFYASGTLISQL